MMILRQRLEGLLIGVTEHLDLIGNSQLHYESNSVEEKAHIPTPTVVIMYSVHYIVIPDGIAIFRFSVSPLP